jgi:hypothetical protein
MSTRKYACGKEFLHPCADGCHCAQLARFDLEALLNSADRLGLRALFERALDAPVHPSERLGQLSHAFGFHPAAKIGSGTQATDAERSDERAGAQRKDPSYIPGFRC